MSPFRSTKGCPSGAGNAPDAARVSPEQLGTATGTATAAGEAAHFGEFSQGHAAGQGVGGADAAAGQGGVEDGQWCGSTSARLCP